MQHSSAFHQQAQNRSKKIYQDIKKLIVKGMIEKEAHSVVKDFLAGHPEINRLWHPVVVKFDQSTAIDEIGYTASDTTLDTIVSVDLGFVIDGIEVDYAETWLVTPNKKLQRLIDSTKEILSVASQRIFEVSPSELYSEIKLLAKEAGYQHVAKTAGHRLGVFPTKKSLTKIRKDEKSQTFEPGGWMIEVHLTDGLYGAFFEDLVFVS